MAAAGGKAVPDRFAGKLSPLVVADNTQKELLRQKQFPLLWGELVTETRVPKSADDAIEMKRAELEALKARNGGAPTGATSAYTATLAANVTKPNPEAGLQKAYKVLRAGT